MQGIDIRAKVDEVWQVMTDYEALEARVPNLVQNRISLSDQSLYQVHWGSDSPMGC